jgi:hypothetical protein
MLRTWTGGSGDERVSSACARGQTTCGRTLAFGLGHCFYWDFGGREGIRTPDPLLAKQVLSQLSYTPIWCNHYPITRLQMPS